VPAVRINKDLIPTNCFPQIASRNVTYSYYQKQSNKWTPLHHRTPQQHTNDFMMIINYSAN